MTPRVTVLMSIFNGARYLRSAVESILAQTFSDFELLIIDDASTDACGEIMRGYSDARIRIIRNDKNIGLTRSLNLGLAQARGDLIARHDDDDVSHPARLELQVAYLDSHRDVALLGCRVEIIDSRGKSLGAERVYRSTTPSGVRWQLLFGNPFVHSTVMFRRDVILNEFGGYNEMMYFNQDFELFSRVVVNRSASNHPRRLLRHRAHLTSLTRRPGVDLDRQKLVNLQSNVDVQRRNVLAILGSEQLAATWPSLWTSINNPSLAGHPEEPWRVGEIIDEMSSLFENKYGADIERDVRSVTAFMRSYLAEYLIGRGERSAALAAFVRAMAEQPLVALRSAPRIVAGLLLGQRLLDRLRQMHLRQ